MMLLNFRTFLTMDHVNGGGAHMEVHIRPGHRARNSDSTSIYYYEIRELKKTFKFNSGNPNYLPEVSFKWKKNGPKLVGFTPDRIKQIDKRIVRGEIYTWSKLQRLKL